jgi:hypothetical protein
VAAASFQRTRTMFSSRTFRTGYAVGCILSSVRWSSLWLVTAPRHFGGRQEYFRCPGSDRRVSVGLVRLSWAASTPIAVGSGKAGVRPRAAIPLGARNGLHRPKRTLISLVARSHRDWRDQRWPHSLPLSAGHRERLLHHGAMICKSSTRTATYCLLTTVVSSTATSPTTLTRMAAPALTAQ